MHVNALQYVRSLEILSPHMLILLHSLNRSSTTRTALALWDNSTSVTCSIWVSKKTI